MTAPSPVSLSMVITHASILLGVVGTLLTGVAALVNAVSGRKTSERNEAAILVVHGLVNGEATALRAELAAARERIAALEGN